MFVYLPAICLYFEYIYIHIFKKFKFARSYLVIFFPNPLTPAIYLRNSVCITPLISGTTGIAQSNHFDYMCVRTNI